VDRAECGSEHHLAVESHGTPLAATLTGGNEPDVKQLIPPVEAIPAVKGKPGAPLKKPEVVMGDRGYDSDRHRTALSGKGIGTQIARRRTEHGSGLGVFRYVVEQTIALFHQFRRLLVRHDRDDAVHEAFMSLACSVICWRRLDAAKG
jgi:transposase